MVLCRFVRACGESRVAHVAQLAEHVLGKDEVIGSIPIMGSRLRTGPHCQPWLTGNGGVSEHVNENANHSNERRRQQWQKRIFNGRNRT